jgi:HD-GYP domain-containing protein (c-di-GMP phosphodiesterase class II)
MVRFSDIINIKDIKEPTSESTEKKTLVDKLRLRDSQILKAKGEEEATDPSIIENGRLEIITYFEKFIERAKNIRDRVKNDQGISPSPILTDLHYIINNNLIDLLYEYAISAPKHSDVMHIQIVNVTFTSLKVGKGMDYDTEMLLRLGLAAFLENVGMYKIPDSIIKKKGRLEEGEKSILKEHPKISYEILGQMGKRYKWLAEVALQIHERADGSGYPNGLKGEEITELALIIGLIDTYASMIKNRTYRDKLEPTDAIKYIIKDKKDLFPSRILKVFLNQISLFPVETYVRLNNKSIGQVLSTDQKQPLRPTIQLLYDGLGNRMEKQEVVRLSENPLLYIIDSIHEKDLP